VGLFGWNALSYQDITNKIPSVGNCRSFERARPARKHANSLHTLTDAQQPAGSVHVLDRPRARSNSGRQPRFGLRSVTMNKFAKNDSGGTAVEYGLIVAAISVAILTVLNAVSAPLIDTFSSIPTQLAESGGNK
jgi:pilus assembly protein Flp/PilA